MAQKVISVNFSAHESEFGKNRHVAHDVAEVNALLDQGYIIKDTIHSVPTVATPVFNITFILVK